MNALATSCGSSARPSITTTLEQLEKSVARLLEVIGDIETRLEPVRVTDPTPELPSDMSPPPTRCIIDERIDNATTKVIRAFSRLESLYLEIRI